MNIDDMTYGQLKGIAALFGGVSQATAPHPMVGQHVILRTVNAGVHAGVLVSQVGDEAVLSGARRLWRWTADGPGIALSAVAVHGVQHKDSKIDVALDKIALTGVIETIPTTAKARGTIDAA